jgi:RNA polymerase sigma factor (sigma-70 family)
MPEATFQEAYPLALRAAEVRAKVAVASSAIPLADRQDLQQEALTACWRALPSFDPNRASLRTFVELVVASRLASMHRARRCRPRLQPLGHDPYSADDAWAREIELRSDVHHVLAALQDGDRRVAVALMECTPTEASRLLEVGRSTIYERIRRIRGVFEAAGLGPRGGGSGGRTLTAEEESR